MSNQSPAARKIVVGVSARPEGVEGRDRHRDDAVTEGDENEGANDLGQELPPDRRPPGRAGPNIVFEMGVGFSAIAANARLPHRRRAFPCPSQVGRIPPNRIVNRLKAAKRYATFAGRSCGYVQARNIVLRTERWRFA